MFRDVITGEFTVTFSILVVCFILLVWWCYTCYRRPSGIPPGPPVYIPFLGHLPQLILRDPRDQMLAWRKQYGDVFSIYFGGHLVIVLSGYDTLREAFVKHGDVFSDRSRLFMAEMISHGLGIISSSGQLWKEQRTFALEALRGFGFGKSSFQDRIQEEVSVFLTRIEEEGGQAHDIKRLIQTSVANVICSIVLGRRFEHDDHQFRTFLAAMDDNVDGALRNQAVTIWPILWYLPGDLFKIRQILKNVEMVEKYFREIIQEHEDNFDENDIRDFIGAYIKKIRECKEKGEKTSYNEENMIKVIGDLYAAGTETSATTVRWFLAYILNYPQYQTIIQAEIDNHVGRSRLPSLQDKPSLPYLEATILEVMRIASIVPFGVPHATSKELQFRGFRFPQGVAVMPILNSVLEDPTLFRNPMEFRPERFLDKDGKVQKPDEHIPFSLGRRVCLGESLARMELFLFLSAMFQRFSFLPPEGEQPPPLEGDLGITFFPKPYKIRAVPRTD